MHDRLNNPICDREKNLFYLWINNIKIFNNVRRHIYEAVDHIRNVYPINKILTYVDISCYIIIII